MDATTVQFEDELSAFEYMMFRADADAHSRSSLMFIETLDQVPDQDRLRDQLERTTRVAARLRQRVVAPLVPLAPARWVVDPDFALDYHFRRVVLPSPGTFRQLLDLAATLHATPLDQARPLWEVTLVEGLAESGSQAALCWKFSHSVADGVAGMVLDQMIHQESREPHDSPMPPMPIPEDVTSLDLTRDAVRRLPASTLRGSWRGARGSVRAAGRAVRHPVDTASSGAQLAGQVQRLVRSTAAEPSPLLRRRSLERRYEALEFPLARLRGAAKSQECSVNDAYLAALAGAMRIYHEHQGVPLDELGVGMPVNARDTGKSGSGNEWSAVTLRVPVSETDVARRMRRVREQVLTARAESTLDPARLLAPALAWVPQRLMSSAGGTGNLGFDIQASNVPGHPTERYIAGSRITRSVPMGPLPGVAMMATMVSFSGTCFVGVNYDTAAFTDVDLLHQSLQRGFEEVLQLAPPPEESGGGKGSKSSGAGSSTKSSGAGSSTKSSSGSKGSKVSGAGSSTKSSSGSKGSKVSGAGSSTKSSSGSKSTRAGGSTTATSDGSQKTMTSDNADGGRP